MKLFEDRLQLVKVCAAHSGETTKTKQNENSPQANAGVKMQGNDSSKRSWKRGGESKQQTGLIGSKH